MVLEALLDLVSYVPSRTVAMLPQTAYDQLDITYVFERRVLCPEPKAASVFL